MKYLQVMPTDQSAWEIDFGVLLAVSVALTAVIVLFDRSKAILNWVSKRKSSIH